MIKWQVLSYMTIFYQDKINVNQRTEVSLYSGTSKGRKVGIRTQRKLRIKPLGCLDLGPTLFPTVVFMSNKPKYLKDQKIYSEISQSTPTLHLDNLCKPFRDHLTLTPTLT